METRSQLSFRQVFGLSDAWPATLPLLQASGPQMVQAVLAGGQEAQDRAQALLSVFCVDPVGVALQAAFDYLKQGSGGLTAVQK